MDPDACLKEIRELVKSYNEDYLPEVHRLIELVESLDSHLSNGGFLPAAWAKFWMAQRRYF